MRAKRGGSKYAFEYADVSADRDAPLWADVHAEVRHDVCGLGFHHLGYAHAWQRRGHAHLVHEVLASPDRRTQAVLGGPAPSLDLITLFEDGSILCTMLSPERTAWLFLAPGMRAHRADRHFVEAVRGVAADVLGRHEERVAARMREAKSEPVPVDSMRVHFAVRLRAGELMVARFPPHFALAGGLSGAATAVALWAAYRRGLPALGGRLSQFELWFFSVLAACVGGFLVFQVSLWWIAPYLVRLRPGPRPVPAETLLERARTIESRPLPGEDEW